MSDLLTIRGIDTETANRLLKEWAKSRPWARSPQVLQRWEPAELEFNGRNAVRFLTGKHKDDFADLVLHLAREGVRVIHIMLRNEERFEKDLFEWAEQVVDQQRGKKSGF